MGSIMPSGVSILGARAIRPGADGTLGDDALVKEKRLPKVGRLPEKARMVLAAARSILPASVPAASEPAEDIGVALGTVHGSMDAVELCLRTMQSDGFGKVVPSWYATGLPNATAAILASCLGLGGPNLTLLGHHAGIEAVVFGCRQIALGRARSMLAGGFDMPGAFFAEQLAPPADRRPGAGIQPGVGLMRLSGDPAAEGALARIVGWSQSFHAGGALADGDVEALVDGLLAGAGSREPPRVHIIDPARPGGADHLAATGPIHVVENVIEQGAPGLHAIIGKGYGPQLACLLVRKD